MATTTSAAPTGASPPRADSTRRDPISVEPEV